MSKNQYAAGAWRKKRSYAGTTTKRFTRLASCSRVLLARHYGESTKFTANEFLSYVD